MIIARGVNSAVRNRVVDTSNKLKNYKLLFSVT